MNRTSLEQVIFYFVYNLYNHVLRDRSGKTIQNNDFMKLKNLDSFFNLGLVIEEVLKERFVPRAEYYISDGICQLASIHGWIPQREGKNAFKRKLTGFDLKLSPSITIPILLTGNPLYDGRPLRMEMRFLLLAWHLRNYAGHNIRIQDILVQKYDQIFEWLIYALFLSIS